MKKTISIAVLVCVLLAVFTGCRAKTKTETAKNKDTLNIKVGTTGTYEPFSYVDNDGKITGYDIEVLRLVQAADPTLNFEFITGSWESLFPGLDADKFQLLANQIISTQERLNKYYLTDNAYFVSVIKLVVKKGRTDINSLKDLQGKKIGTSVGSANARLLEDWNDQNGKILNITYYEAGGEIVMLDIANGRIDATTDDPISVQKRATVQGLDIETVGDNLNVAPAFYIIKKDEQGALIKKKVDAALAKIRDDGSLTKLSIDWFGVDYSR